MRILIADDEREITRALKAILEKKNYSVDTVGSGREALEYIEGCAYDGIVLDIMMPDVDGLEVLRRIRKKGITAPVLLLTAKASVEDRVAGLEAGADDYLTKPFATSEFVARVRALLRRSPTYLSEKLTFGDLTLDCASYELSSGGRTERLNNKEFQMMEMFMRNPRSIISAEQFMERIWGWESETEINVVWVNISYLRRKLGGLGCGVAIRSVRGVGYALDDLAAVAGAAAEPC